MVNDISDSGDTRDTGFWRMIGVRLRDARYIIAVAGLLLAVLRAAGSIGTVALLLGFVAIMLAAAAPRRSRTLRLAERRQRENIDMTWHRAIEIPLQALDEAAFLLRSDSTVKFQNGAAAQLFGVAEPDSHLSGRVRSPAILGIVQQAIEDGAATAIEHVERVPSERWYQVRCAPLMGTPGQERGGRLFLLTFRDMSEAKRMDRMRTDFVANASHELRTPLASLLGFIETIQGPAQNDPQARERFLSIMHEQASRMTRLVADLMSLSRLELKAHMLPTETIDLGMLIGHVCDTLRPLASDLGVTISLRRPEAPVLIRGASDELIQVFENLIENACKYGQSGKAVEVAIGDMDGAAWDGAVTGDVEVSVRDHGPGIAPEHVPRLTERFYRVDIETSRSKKGTGLGLAIVKHILTRHRTRLVVQSRLGEGSVFTVKFSRAQPVDNLSSFKNTV